MTANIRGQCFGRLTALDVTRMKDGSRGWLCQCKCGSKINVITNKLLSGGKSDCGCVKKQKAEFRAAELDIVKSRHNSKDSRIMGKIDTWNINPYRLSIEGMALVMEWRASGHEVQALADRLNMSAMTLRRYIKQAETKGFNAWKGYVL